MRNPRRAHTPTPIRRRRNAGAFGARALRVLVPLLILGVFGGALWFVYDPARQISTVSVQGLETLPEATVRDTAWSVVHTSALVPHTFIYAVPLNAIATAVQAIPEVADAVVTRDGRTVVVQVTERTPYALWCAEQGTPCMFIDKTGMAFNDAPPLTGGRYVQHILAGQTPSKGTRIPNPERIARSDTFSAYVETRGRSLERVFTTTDGDEHYMLAGGGEIILREADSMEYCTKLLDTLFASPRYKNLTKTPFTSIDIRFGARAYVKEKPVEQEQPEPATAPGTTTGTTTPVEQQT